MNTFFPILMLIYLECFRQVFSKANYKYFKAYVWAMLIIKSRKCVTNIAHSCFFLDRHIGSFARFLSDNQWDMDEVSKVLFHLLIEELGTRLCIYGAFLLAIDTTHVKKSSKKMLGVQKWIGHISNSQHKTYLIGHHWAIGGLISSVRDRFLCWPILTQMISGQKKSFTLCFYFRRIASNDFLGYCFGYCFAYKKIS